LQAGDLLDLLRLRVPIYEGHAIYSFASSGESDKPGSL
jgi:hypothetical protein